MKDVRSWLFCENQWFYDFLDIAKEEKDLQKRIQLFHSFITQPIDTLFEEYCIIKKKNIKKYVKEWFFEEDVSTFCEENTHITYWFFNIYTGKILHISYFIKCTDLIEE